MRPSRPAWLKRTDVIPNKHIEALAYRRDNLFSEFRITRPRTLFHLAILVGVAPFAVWQVSKWEMDRRDIVNNRKSERVRFGWLYKHPSEHH